MKHLTREFQQCSKLNDEQKKALLADADHDRHYYNTNESDLYDHASLHKIQLRKAPKPHEAARTTANKPQHERICNRAQSQLMNKDIEELTRGRQTATTHLLSIPLDEEPRPTSINPKPARQRPAAAARPPWVAPGHARATTHRRPGL